LALASLHEANGNPESPASEVVLQLDFEWGLGMNYAVSEDNLGAKRTPRFSPDGMCEINSFQDGYSFILGRSFFID
jgi:hypothetical protein